MCHIISLEKEKKTDEIKSYSCLVCLPRVVSGFVIGCPCGVWQRGLTTCPLFVAPFCGKSNRNGLVSKIDTVENGFFLLYIFIESIYWYTSPKKSFRSVMAPSVTAIILIIFSNVLSVSPRVLTSEANFILKGMSRIVNFPNWPWVWKHLIIDIRMLKNLLCCNTLVRKFAFSNFAFDSFKT